MNEREELEALRRLAVLEAKAKGAKTAPERSDAAAGGGTLRLGPLDTKIPLSENVNNFLAGAGQNIHGLATGLSQYVYGGASRADVAEQRRLDGDLNKRKAAMAGSLLSNIPLAFIPGGGSLRGAAAIGAVTGLAQPSVSNTETVGNAVLGVAGSAAGQMAGNRLSQMIAGRSALPRQATNATQNINVGPSSAGANANVITNPQATARTSQMVSVGDDVSAGLTDGQRSALNRGRQIGMRTTPGQETGSKVLQQLEAKLESQPASSGTFFDIKNNNQRVLNRSVATELGEDAAELSSDVLDRAYTRMGAVFDSVADDVPRALDPDSFLTRLAQVEADNEGMLSQPLADSPLVTRYLNLISSGQPTGAQLNNLQSQIGKAANSKRMTDPAQAQALREVQHMILDDISTGLAPEAAQAFNQARQQYRVYSMLADKPNVLNASTGNVSGANLANVLQRTDRSGFALGRRDSPMYDAAHFVQAFKPLVGDSGTATRSPLNMLELAVSVPTNIATRAYASTPSIRIANSLATMMNDGVAPNSLSPTHANALRRLIGVSGNAAGIGASPLVFGNAAQ